MSVYLGLILAAGVLGAVGIVEANGRNVVAWGVLLLALALALGRLG